MEFRVRGSRSWTTLVLALLVLVGLVFTGSSSANARPVLGKPIQASSTLLAGPSSTPNGTQSATSAKVGRVAPRAGATPLWQLPFENGQRWQAGAPHTSNGNNVGVRGSIDFGPVAGANSRVVAVAAGTVYKITCSGGYYLGIDHGNGWRSTYYHLTNQQGGLVGQRVEAGTYLGTAGMATPCGGSATFNHVHLTILADGAATAVSGMRFGNYRVYSSGSDYYGYWNDLSGNRVVTNSGAAACCVVSSTAPSTTPTGWEVMFNSGTLWAVGKDMKGDMRLGLAPRTSPAITRLASGGWESAFHGADGSLWIVGEDTKGRMGLGMASGTSPSIAGLAGGGWEAAFQGADGSLWIVGKDNRGRMGLGMAPGTSPSIAALPGGGWQVAFQAADRTLWVIGKDNRGSLGLGMAAKTSPGIAALNTGGWEVAFQANTGHLWMVGADTKGDMGLGLAPGTSPAITAMPGGGWEAAFQANGGALWVIGKDNRGTLGLGMAAGSSPSITATAGGWEVAFRANTGRLWMVGADTKGDMGLGIAAYTNPAVIGL